MLGAGIGGEGTLPEPQIRELPCTSALEDALRTLSGVFRAPSTPAVLLRPGQLCRPTIAGNGPCPAGRNSSALSRPLSFCGISTASGLPAAKPLLAVLKTAAAVNRANRARMNWKWLDQCTAD